jgi:cytochrome P450
MSTEIPLYDVDLFSDEALRSPFDHYRNMRDLGAVIRLRHPEVYVLSRFAEVREALDKPEVFSSASGVGFSELFNAPYPPTVIGSDGLTHRKLRAEVTPPLTPAALRENRPRLKQLIKARVESLIDVGPFDAMREIATFLPTVAISEMVGLPEEGRAAMLEWGTANFNAVGPEDPKTSSDFAVLSGAREYFQTLDPGSLRKGSWSSRLFDSVKAGKLSEQQARGLLRAYVLPSLDTTILAKGHLLNNLATSPRQWRLLRDDASLISGAVLEGVRHSAVVRWFSRVTKVDFPSDGHVVPAGARVMLIYASANRDERRFIDPDTFDIKRDARQHLAWGTGPHVCAGMHLAKMEMEVMLEALAEHGVELKAGAPEVAINRGLYGLKSLPFELRSAASLSSRPGA